MRLPLKEGCPNEVSPLPTVPKDSMLAPAATKCEGSPLHRMSVSVRGQEKKTNKEHSGAVLGSWEKHIFDHTAM